MDKKNNVGKPDTAIEAVATDEVPKSAQEPKAMNRVDLIFTDKIPSSENPSLYSFVAAVEEQQPIFDAVAFTERTCEEEQINKSEEVESSDKEVTFDAAEEPASSALAVDSAGNHF